MTTPTVYRNFNRKVFLWFQESETHDYFIVAMDGEIQIQHMSKDRSALLILLEPPNNAPAHCADVWMKSHLTKDDRVTRLLVAIRDGQPFPRIMGLVGSEGDIEREAMTNADKMTAIGQGAARIMRKSGKPSTTIPGSDKIDAPAPKRERKGRASDPNAVPLASICEGLKIDPSDARRLIRGAAWKKPDTGRWEWDKTEVAGITQQLQSLIEVDKGE